jgi:muramoyltetrapeptide carboxypeptidase
MPKHSAISSESTRGARSLAAQRLRAGDTIGIVSPSAPINDEYRSQLDRGIELLQGLGFKIELAPHALSNSLGYSASAQEKADDINQMFRRDDIKAIISSQGGFNCNSVLSYLDYDLIKEKPKIFLGISDITSLLNALYAKTGLITFHGNDIMWGFGRNPTEYDISEFLIRLVGGEVGPVTRRSVWGCVREGTAFGRLVGGHLGSLLRLAGTEYFPDCHGAILFLESFGRYSGPDKIYAEFFHLKQLGILAKINGLWLGHYDHPSGLKLEDIAHDAVAEYDFPIVSCDDFGHTTPNTTIPIGCEARIDAANSRVELIGPCLA